MRTGGRGRQMLRLIKSVADEEEPTGVVESPEDVDLVRAVLSLGGVPWAELDDGLQIVRLKLLEARTRAAAGDDGPIRKEQAWLAVVSSNVAVDWHRQHARDARVRDKLAATLDQYWSLRGSTADSAEARETAVMVAEALELLSPPHRQVVILRYWVDLTVPEIARHLSVPAGTVKSRLHMATRVLRDALSDAGSGPASDSPSVERGCRDA